MDENPSLTASVSERSSPNAYSRLVRFAAVIAIVGNATYGFVTERFGSVTSRTVSDAYPTLFTPAPYTFSIWGMIYASMLTIAVYGLLPGQRENSIFDRLALGMVGMNLTAVAWLAAFHAQALLLSLGIIVVFLGFALDAFLTAHVGVARRETSYFVTAPFSLALGWIAVATVADAAATFVSLGVDPFSEASARMAMVLVGLSAVFACLLAARFDDFVLPAVVCWASMGILVARRGDSPDVATVAFFATIISASAVAGSVYERVFPRQVSGTSGLRTERRSGFPPSLEPRDSWA
jgi:hypothetical protein